MGAENREVQWSGRRDSNPRPLAPQASGRLPRFSPNFFLSLLLHNFGASAFARNAYGLAPLMGEFSDSFLTVVAAARSDLVADTRSTDTQLSHIHAAENS